MREVGGSDRRFRVWRGLLQGRCDWLVLLTAWNAHADRDSSTRWPREIAALGRPSWLRVEPVAALKEFASSRFAPNRTPGDPLAALEPVPLAGVGWQSTGVPTTRSRVTLAAPMRSAAVTRAVARRCEPLRRAVQALCGAEAEAILFTSGSNSTTC